MLSIRTQLIVPYSRKFAIVPLSLFVSIYLLTVTISLYNNAKGDEKKGEMKFQKKIYMRPRGCIAKKYKQKKPRKNKKKYDLFSK